MTRFAVTAALACCATAFSPRTTPLTRPAVRRADLLVPHLALPGDVLIEEGSIGLVCQQRLQP